MSTVTGLIDIDDAEHHVVRSGIAYWRRLKAHRAYPSQQQLLPREISGLLRNVALVRVVDGGEDYEFRIYGEAHVQATVGNMQGCQMRDVDRFWPGMAASLQKLYSRVVQTRQPFGVRTVRNDCPGQNPLAIESVLLPLGPDSSSVDHILVFTVYTPLNAVQEKIAG